MVSGRVFRREYFWIQRCCIRRSTVGRVPASLARATWIKSLASSDMVTSRAGSEDRMASKVARRFSRPKGDLPACGQRIGVLPLLRLEAAATTGRAPSGTRQQLVGEDAGGPAVHRLVVAGHVLVGGRVLLVGAAEDLGAHVVLRRTRGGWGKG